MKQKIRKRIIISLALIFSLIAGLLPAGWNPAFIHAKEKEDASHTLTNPTRDSAGNVTWDCVWFGSYPQTEVVSSDDNTQLAAMAKMNTNYETKYETVSASVYQQIAGASYDGNGDATVNGVKYRRIKKGDATGTADNDGYYQWIDGESYHYFRYEPIKWRVLSVEGKDTFLLADIGLDDKYYHERLDPNAWITWNNSTIRSWLNGYKAASNLENKDYSGNNFLDSAFRTEEQAAIYDSTILTEDGTKSGNNTTDKVFLLSVGEASKASFGLSANYNIADKARGVKTGTYAKAMGCYVSTSSNYVGSYYWLRSPVCRYQDKPAVPGIHYYPGHQGYITEGAAVVEPNGCLYNSGANVYSGNIAVRPALHFNLSASSLANYAGTVSSTGAMDEKQPGQVSIKPAGNTITPPAKVKEVKLKKNLKNVNSAKLTVTFNKVKKAKGYQIYCSTNKKFAKAKKVTIGKTKYTFKKLKKGKTYYVKVKAYKMNGKKKVYGKWSEVKKIKLK